MDKAERLARDLLSNTQIASERGILDVARALRAYGEQCRRAGAEAMREAAAEKMRRFEATHGGPTTNADRVAAIRALPLRAAEAKDDSHDQ